jgi:hypothetical protein
VAGGAEGAAPCKPLWEHQATARKLLLKLSTGDEESNDLQKISMLEK